MIQELHATSRDITFLEILILTSQNFSFFYTFAVHELLNAVGIGMRVAAKTYSKTGADPDLKKGLGANLYQKVKITLKFFHYMHYNKKNSYTTCKSYR